MDWKKKHDPAKGNRENAGSCGKRIKESCSRMLQDEQNGERLYLVALIGYLAISMWATTTFPMTDRMANHDDDRRNQGSIL